MWYGRVLLSPELFTETPMTRDDFRRAYSAARWTLHNLPLADLEIALPRDPLARRIILALLAMTGQFRSLQT